MSDEALMCVMQAVECWLGHLSEVLRKYVSYRDVSFKIIAQFLIFAP
jgi:hypothetical protein